MVLALWIVQVLLALTFSVAAGRKLVRQKGNPSKGMAWREDFSQRTVRLVGVLELLGAMGLLLPAPVPEAHRKLSGDPEGHPRDGARGHNRLMQTAPETTTKQRREQWQRVAMLSSTR
ncbi:MAG: DoxX family protein [Rubrobacter sp.]